MSHWGKRAGTAFAFSLAASLSACAAAQNGLVAYEVVGGAIPAALTSEPGDAQRGRAIIVGRNGNCLLCHAIPETGEKFMGNVARPLGYRIAAQRASCGCGSSIRRASTRMP